MDQNRIGLWIEGELRSRDWRQADLARRARVSTTAVSDWVRGKKVPDPASCDLLSDIFHADLDFVLDLAGHRPPDSNDDPASPANRLSALLHRVQWNPDREAVVEGIIRGFIDRDRRDSVAKE
jgi:transcriptional regulator with XRE-family HTH domain